MVETLKGEAALKLWRQGKDAWNAWIEKNPGMDIDFSGVDFSEHCGDDGIISFEGFNFGDGNVSFNGACFEGRNVSFDRASFGGTSSAKTDIIFYNAQFMAPKVSFNRMVISNSDIHFDGSEFTEAKITFKEASINGNFFFGALKLSNSEIDFSYLQSKNGDFSVYVFIIGTVNLIFDRVFFGGSFDFKSLEKLKPSSGWVNEKLDDNTAIAQFSLKGASFSSILSLSGNFDCIPDLRMSKISHHLDLSEVRVTLKRRGCWIEDKTAIDTEDHVRLRRLKELAESAKDHASALRFSADENRAMRWIHRNRWQSDLDALFSLTSNYGQSILRPFLGLVLAWGVAAGILWGNAPETAKDPLFNSALLSAAHTVPFLPLTKGIIDASTKALFSEPPPPWVSALTLAESLLSFIFLFLIGLGLRNRFRL